MIGVLTEKQCKEVLQSNFLGRLGCNDNGKTYIVPINYLFDGGAIIAHSQVGMKIRMMRNNPEVCFEVDEIKSYTNWKSIIAWGTYREITDEKEKMKAMKSFVDHLLHLKVSETAQPPETSAKRLHPRSFVEMVVYKIIISKITGRFESGEEGEW